MEDIALNTKLVRKLIIAAVLLGAVVYLFLTSIQSTNAEPYTVNPAELARWRLVVEEPGRPALVGLQPAEQLRHDLYRQVFQRMMISLFQPDLSMPLVLQSEY